MPLTLESVDKRTERAWSQLLASLPAWELHRLVKGEQELILHDAYASGEMSMEDIRLLLSFVEEESHA
jgi:hypothetical protein